MVRFSKDSKERASKRIEPKEFDMFKRRRIPKANELGI